MAEEVLQAYVATYGNRPRTANELLQFAKKQGQDIGYGDAKKLIDGSKGNKDEKNSTQLQYAIGDLILMTKDRHAIIKYIGPVPEMGDNNIYYGVELIDGTVGHHDGIIKGKRYFQTEGKRAMFIPLSKIRRIMTAKDHKRQESYFKLHSTVASLKDQGNPDKNSSPSDDGNLHAQNDPLEVLSIVEMDVQNENKQDIEQNIIKSLKEAKEKSEKNEKMDDKTLQNNNQNHKKSQSKDILNESNNKNHEHKSSSQAKIVSVQPQSKNDTFRFVNYNDILLNYILEQMDENIRNQLYDLYCNPTTHAILLDAFAQIKSISDYNKQKNLWDSLFKRWQKYIQ